MRASEGEGTTCGSTIGGISTGDPFRCRCTKERERKGEVQGRRDTHLGLSGINGWPFDNVRGSWT